MKFAEQYSGSATPNCLVVVTRPDDSIVLCGGREREREREEEEKVEDGGGVWRSGAVCTEQSRESTDVQRSLHRWSQSDLTPSPCYDNNISQH